MKTEYVDITDMLGRTFSRVICISNEEIIFSCNDGTEYRMLHEQSCFENVEINEIEGYLEGLCGSPILVAESPSSKDEPAKSSDDESYTWTFYKLANINGHVDIRWYGTSNGYYAEDVKIIRNTPNPPPLRGC
jgi:hypothetical protein